MIKSIIYRLPQIVFEINLFPRRKVCIDFGQKIALMIIEEKFNVQ